MIDIENGLLKRALNDEKEWLSSYRINNNCWSSFHASKHKFNVKMMNDVSSIMPLIREKVNTLDTQFHCMKIIKNTVSVINEGQTPVDVCDQPVYALSKQIQWRFPELFRDYFCLFGALHVEKSLLVIMVNGVDYLMFLVNAIYR